MATRFELNKDPALAAYAVNFDALMYLIDYRGAVHPYAGVPLVDQRATAIKNYLGGLVYRFCRKQSIALELSDWTYLVMEPARQTSTNRRFVALSRRLSRCLVTPGSSGLTKGAHFWGSCTLSRISRDKAVTALRADDRPSIFRMLGEASTPAFRECSLYRSPVSTSVVGAVVDRELLILPGHRREFLGSYPGSERFRGGVSDFDLSDTGSNAATRQLSLIAPESPPAVSSGDIDIRSIDDWGEWCEIVPHVNAAEIGLEGGFEQTKHASRDLSLVDLQPVQTALEPLIRELWSEVSGLEEGRRAEASQLHFALIELSDALRSAERGRLRRSLAYLLTVIVAIATSVAGSAVYARYEDAIREVIDHYL